MNSVIGSGSTVAGPATGNSPVIDNVARIELAQDGCSRSDGKGSAFLSTECCTAIRRAPLNMPDLPQPTFKEARTVAIAIAEAKAGHR